MRLLLLSFFILIFDSCDQEDVGSDLPTRTVIVYMIADNNLDYFAVKDINEMELGFNEDLAGNLVVYVDRAEGASPSHPVVYNIRHDTTGIIMSEISLIYKEQNSADPEVMNRVLSDIIEKYPAKSYGLVLWSHGSAWYPRGSSLTDSRNKIIEGNPAVLPLTKSFGRDHTDELDIPDLKGALPAHFDFILFDACYMGSMEVAYELRTCTDYLISSATEVLSTGYPYQGIISKMFDQTIHHENIAKAFFTSYDTLKGVLKSATVAVVRTSGLDNLARQAKRILNDSSNLKKVTCDDVQQYATWRGNFLFDIKAFIGKATTNKALYNDFSTALHDVVVFKASTTKILDNLEISDFSGMSVFIPDSANLQYYSFYKHYDWYEESDCGLYFDRFYKFK